MVVLSATSKTPALSCVHSNTSQPLPAIRPAFSQSRVQVCDLQRIFITQPCILSELPETLPEPL